MHSTQVTDLRTGSDVTTWPPMTDSERRGYRYLIRLQGEDGWAAREYEVREATYRTAELVTEIRRVRTQIALANALTTVLQSRGMAS